MLHALHLALEALLVQGLHCHLALPLEPPSEYAWWDGTSTLQFFKGLRTLRTTLCLPRLWLRVPAFQQRMLFPHPFCPCLIQSKRAEPISGPDRGIRH